MWTAAILAGGQARRLGGLDKGALVVDGRRILDRQLAVVRDLTPHVMIIGRSEVPDRIPGAGALGGIYTALVHASTDLVLVLAGDMPFVTTRFLARLAEVATATPVDAVVPRDGAGRHPLCAMYRRQAGPRLRVRIDRGALRVLDALDDLNVLDFGPDELASFDPDGRLLTNVNTPDDFERAQTR